MNTELDELIGAYEALQTAFARTLAILRELENAIANGQRVRENLVDDIQAAHIALAIVRQKLADKLDEYLDPGREL